MNISNDKIGRLVQYVKGIQNNLDGKDLYTQFKDDIDKVNPQDAFKIFHSLLKEDIEPKEILVFLDKIINVFYKSLSSYKWEMPENDNFLRDLMEENKAIIKKLNNIKEILKVPSLDIKKKKLLPKIEELQLFNDHYLKKENILFPYMEQKSEVFEGVSIMWALHDEVRSQIKEMIELLKGDEEEAVINSKIGKIFFAIIGLVKKEELILFPTANEILSDQDWYDMHRQSLDYKFPFITKSHLDFENNKEDTKKFINRFNDSYKFKTETGELTFDQISMIFNALPIDLTFVDENNKVRFFTSPKDRIFPRSPAIIGRDVKNCHPPDSVHIVHEIIESFRSGERNTASFWINLNEKIVLIKYYSLRDSSGNYRGVLEVSQDITEIKKLEGERRLLEW